MPDCQEMIWYSAFAMRQTSRKNTKVFVGLSGGVDSAVSAALLVDAGYQVTGVFIEGWHPPHAPCSWKEDRRDAIRVAAHLGIPFQTLDAKEAYRIAVGEYLIESYKSGLTPNPDIVCNREIKFGVFLDLAKKAGADMIATGHYARLRFEEGNPVLMEAVDHEKDQSYFLSMLTKDQLRSVYFPIGELYKREVRKIAEVKKLPVAEKPDSQGICFLGDISMHEFLREYIPTNPGQVLSEEGKVIGIHEGVSFYTLGERHGFTVHTPSRTPLYVVRKDMAVNTITVAPRSRLESSPRIRLSDIILRENFSGTVDVVTRYHGVRIPASCVVIEGNLECELLGKNTEPIAPGQVVALYRGHDVLGAGVVVYS